MQTKTISYQYTWIWKSKSKQTKMTISLLVKMQSSWNAQTMLVGKQDYTATLEKQSAFQKFPLRLNTHLQRNPVILLFAKVKC